MKDKNHLMYSDEYDLAQALLSNDKWCVSKIKKKLKHVAQCLKLKPTSQSEPPTCKKIRLYLFENNQKFYLTQREYQCLSMIFKGDTQPIVAEKLGLSIRTVEYYVKNVKKRWEVQTLADIHDRLSVSDTLHRAIP